MHVRSMAKRNGNSVINDPTVLGLPAALVSCAVTLAASSFPSRPTPLNVVGITVDAELCGGAQVSKCFSSVADSREAVTNQVK